MYAGKESLLPIWLILMGQYGWCMCVCVCDCSFACVGIHNVVGHRWRTMAAIGFPTANVSDGNVGRADAYR